MRGDHSARPVIATANPKPCRTKRRLKVVRRFLLELGDGETETERLKREERALRERITAFRASDRLSRDDLHHRNR
jgi:hypothetical protein